ncbi:MAG TPA: NAD-dependent epimerase/dehydratase family protein [Streptosporangiaceae bacterium]|nr:NAD-dependent epimerase/dehydratase family protein [Streptosporangiaceae bacterium]
MRVFITGIAGFVGSNLARRLLAEGFSVGGIDDLSAGLPSQVPAQADFAAGDITTADLASAMRGADVVFHLAAFSSIPGCQRDLVRAAAVHAVGTARVLQAAHEAGVSKVIAAETAAIYEGTTLYPTPETEDQPRTFYGVTKRCVGQFVNAFAQDRKVRATTLRYFNVYGPYQDYRREVAPLIPAFILALLRGEPPVIYGDGSKSRDLIHIDDVNGFHLLAIHDQRTDGQVFNLGTGHATSVSEVLTLVRARLGAGQPPVYRPDLPAEAPRTQADISRARTLGWEPRIGLREGIESCIEFLRPIAAQAAIAGRPSP